MGVTSSQNAALNQSRHGTCFKVKGHEIKHKYSTYMFGKPHHGVDILAPGETLRWQVRGWCVCLECRAVSGSVVSRNSCLSLPELRLDLSKIDTDLEAQYGE